MQTYITAPDLTATYMNHIWSTLPKHLRPTLFLAAQRLSEQLDCEITIASETFQHTGSFKFRAADNLLASVPQ